MKKWLLTSFVFFCFIEIVFFAKSHHFLYFFIRHQFLFSARKCSLCQTLACADRRSHKQKRLLLWDIKLLKKDRNACLRFCFSNPQFFGNVKRTSLVYLCCWQRFPTNLRDASPLLCSTKFLLNGQKKMEYLQAFRKKFPQIVIVEK